MADLQKFLNQSGVSIFWTRVAEEISKVDTKVTGHETRLVDAENKIDALEKNAYDDTAVRELISANDKAIKDNAADILTLETAVGTLNAGADTQGSVAHTATAIAAAEVAKIVAGADVSFDTLKEIADWILNDTTGAANMANDIAALEAKLAGIDTTVVAHVASAVEAALKVDGVDKYALASDLTALADRVKALEDAGYQNAEQVSSAIDAKITALNLANTYDAKGAASAAETNAKAHADSLNSAMNTRVAVLEAIDHTKFEAAGAAAQALIDAKAYTDTEINTKIVALTADEIDAAINEAKAQMNA